MPKNVMSMGGDDRRSTHAREAGAQPRADARNKADDECYQIGHILTPCSAPAGGLHPCGADSPARPAVPLKREYEAVF